MKEIKISVQEPYLSFILNGQKTVEGRLNKGGFAKIEKGDSLVLENNKFEIIENKKYNSFREMIISEGIENVIPDKENIDEAVDVYYKFYTKKQEKEFGVCAIKIRKID